ncbi:MAG: LD-carboxypeptidase [Candidatus Omnitrophica bacterium]|nr:LD-carboxypeptidase [Candidatus Omnitrophota bacterium]
MMRIRMRISHRRKVRPKRLRHNDTIGIVAPASSFDRENFKRGVSVLRRLGYKVVYERAIFSKYWSKPGHNEQRAHQINRMFADNRIKAILCAKAGCGSTGIIPYLDKDVIRAHPKIFVGYSDITILLLYLQAAANMVVFHGPVVSGEMYEDMNPATMDYLLRLITQPHALGRITFPSLRYIKPGRATGMLVGGNISLIVEAIGTPFEIDTDNKILFLEEIGEDLEVITGYFERLKRSGAFKKIRGLIFGRMVDCFEDLDPQEGIISLIHRELADLAVPVLFGFPSGHTQSREGLHVTLPFGTEVSIDSDNLSLLIEQAAVK